MAVTDLAWKHHEQGRYHAGILTNPDVIRQRALSLSLCLSVSLSTVSTRALHSPSQIGIKTLRLHKGFGSFFKP